MNLLEFYLVVGSFGARVSFLIANALGMPMGIDGPSISFWKCTQLGFTQGVKQTCGGENIGGISWLISVVMAYKHNILTKNETRQIFHISQHFFGTTELSTSQVRHLFRKFIHQYLALFRQNWDPRRRTANFAPKSSCQSSTRS